MPVMWQSLDGTRMPYQQYLREVKSLCGKYRTKSLDLHPLLTHTLNTTQAVIALTHKLGEVKSLFDPADSEWAGTERFRPAPGDEESGGVGTQDLESEDTGTGEDDGFGPEGLGIETKNSFWHKDVDGDEGGTCGPTCGPCQGDEDDLDRQWKSLRQRADELWNELDRHRDAKALRAHRVKLTGNYEEASEAEEEERRLEREWGDAEEAAFQFMEQAIHAGVCDEGSPFADSDLCEQAREQGLI